MKRQAQLPVGIVAVILGMFDIWGSWSFWDSQEIQASVVCVTPQSSHISSFWLMVTPSDSTFFGLQQLSSILDTVLNTVLDAILKSAAYPDVPISI